jgi:hypothetical protein
VLSITNAGTSPITGTVTLVAVDGETPSDSLGLFPSSTGLPSRNDGNFHGNIIVNMNGPNITLAQEFNSSVRVGGSAACRYDQRLVGRNRR